MCEHILSVSVERLQGSDENRRYCSLSVIIVVDRWDRSCSLDFMRRHDLVKASEVAP